MKFDLKLGANPVSEGWSVELWAEKEKNLIGGHELGQVRVANWLIPVPPLVHQVALPAPYEGLWTNAPQQVALFRGLFARVSQPGQVEAAGRYLFACLLGQDLWEKVQKLTPPDQTLELRLHLDDPDLARLPWEAVRSNSYFLLSDKQINIYRIVAQRPTIAKAEDVLKLPLRILFVIAAGLDDPEINAASEYLSLLKRLQESESLPLEIRLLSTLNGVQAVTFENMKQTIATFKPHVLHLVAHGGSDAGRAYLEFPVENRDEEGRYDAGNMEAALAGTGIQAVVLNACFSGQAPTAPGTNGKANPGLAQVEELAAQTQLVRSSIAARLVEAGIPFVVGMNGRVSDRVCRLFAREFYVGLVQGQSVPDACARGRRAGLAGDYQAEQKIDWALPVLFLRQDGQENLNIDAAKIKSISQLLRQNFPPGRPDFCDRLNYLQAFQALLLPGEVIQPAMALYTSGSEEKGLGKTRLLKEMGSMAVRAGHFACYIPSQYNEGFASFLKTTVAPEIDDAAERWFGPNNEFSLKRLDLIIKAIDDPTSGVNDPDLPESIKKQLRRGLDERLKRRLLAEALGQDLVNLADMLGPDRVVVLLFDDAHMLGTALPDFQDILLSNGLYPKSERVRIIFAFDNAPPAQVEAAQKLYQFAQTNAWINLLRVTPFSREEEVLAYRQYVLRRNPPLVDVGAKDELVKLFRRKVKGRPGNLLLTEQDEIPYLLETEALALADDNELLEKSRK